MGDFWFPEHVTPDEFEAYVEAFLSVEGGKLAEFKIERKELLKGSDGEYEIDVTARFTELSVNFLVLVECKRHRNPIKREVIQGLHQRMQSIGAQKGIVCATAHFQSGAKEFAEAHGIALIEVVEGKAIYVAKAAGPINYPDDLPTISGFRIHTENGAEYQTRFDGGNLDAINAFLNEH